MKRKFCINFLLTTISLVICATIFFGCSSQKVPDGFPQKLVKFNITLLNESKPVEGASVMLIAENAPYVVHGLTGSNGVAILSTSITTYTKLGTPTGNYKAIITHTPKLSSELSNEQLGKMTMDEVNAYRKKVDEEIAAMPKIVPAKWGTKETTPINIKIPESSGSLTIEISDPKSYQQ
ncbi:MAG: hypothetical protein LBB88_11400 [Planctomycetaceae bacterium]|jgi:hypothetical protein|nr:hypothetical protein [Planctomycetaceae bacterium]